MLSVFTLDSDLQVILKVWDHLAVKICQIAFEKHSWYHESPPLNTSMWLIASHWRNFEVLGPAHHSPILPVYSYLVIHAYINLTCKWVHSHRRDWLLCLGKNPRQFSFSNRSLLFSPPCKSHPFLPKTLHGAMQSSRFPAREAQWPKWASPSWCSAYALVTELCVCVYTWLYTYVYGHMPT